MNDWFGMPLHYVGFCTLWKYWELIYFPTHLQCYDEINNCCLCYILSCVRSRVHIRPYQSIQLLDSVRIRLRLLHVRIADHIKMKDPMNVLASKTSRDRWPPTSYFYQQIYLSSVYWNLEVAPNAQTVQKVVDKQTDKQTNKQTNQTLYPCCACARTG